MDVFASVDYMFCHTKALNSRRSEANFGDTGQKLKIEKIVAFHKSS